jgi:hypothetical protein
MMSIFLQYLREQIVKRRLYINFKSDEISLYVIFFPFPDSSEQKISHGCFVISFQLISNKIQKLHQILTIRSTLKLIPFKLKQTNIFL